MVYPTKRSEDRMGHAKTSKDNLPDIDKVEFEATIRLPAQNPEWSPIAKYAWKGVKNSPLRKYWTETDYAFAWAACDALDVAVKRKNATLIAAAESMMRSAMFNESDRRRARIELTRKSNTEGNKSPAVAKNVADFNARRRASG